MRFSDLTTDHATYTKHQQWPVSETETVTEIEGVCRVPCVHIADQHAIEGCLTMFQALGEQKIIHEKDANVIWSSFDFNPVGFEKAEELFDVTYCMVAKLDAFILLPGSVLHAKMKSIMDALVRELKIALAKMRPGNTKRQDFASFVDELDSKQVVLRFFGDPHLDQGKDKTIFFGLCRENEAQQRLKHRPQPVGDPRVMVPEWGTTLEHPLQSVEATECWTPVPDRCKEPVSYALACVQETLLSAVEKAKKTNYSVHALDGAKDNRVPQIYLFPRWDDIKWLDKKWMNAHEPSQSSEKAKATTKKTGRVRKRSVHPEKKQKTEKKRKTEK